jgi:transcriptional regulator with XRE-family HTH domain
MPPRSITPSSYVGPQVREFRQRRGWSQQQLANRLRQLGAQQTGWSQTKIHKLESGKLTRVLVDDVFELALALDVSPLYLLTPQASFDADENALQVWLGGKISRWPRDVRQWIRGVKPVLHLGDYRSDEEAQIGHRFYLFESQSLGEWQLIRDCGEYAGRVMGSLAAVMPADDEPAPS